jgi:predicted acylesterase/phospholipase RssA
MLSIPSLAATKWPRATYGAMLQGNLDQGLNLVVSSETRTFDHAGHPLFISFAGGGIYFFWQLGAVKFLVEQYDLTRVPMAGASSGSIVACLAACGVDPQLIVDEAYQLSIENDIWNRKFGLIGIWGGLIRSWLDQLLPDNAHKLVSGRLHVVIAKAPTLELFEVRMIDPTLYLGYLSEATFR